MHRSFFSSRRAVMRGALALLVALTALAPSAFAKEKFKVEEATIADIQKAILAKELTSVELVKLYLARVKAFNGPGVGEPEGLLGPIVEISHAQGVNALITFNLR